jgi:hypothetical protein
MTPQIPAVGILKRNNWGDAVAYQVVCQCGDSNHDHNVWIEAEDNEISVITYTQQKSKWWEINRWQKIWTLLTRGYIEYEASIIMTEQQALNYAETLKLAIADVKKFKEDHAKSV